MADAQAMTIPKQAIDAAAKAIADSIGHGMSEKCFDHARDALTAAAPHMHDAAREQALDLSVLERLAKIANEYDEPDENGPFPDIQDAMISIRDLRQIRQLLATIRALKYQPAQAEEVIAAERMKLEATARVGLQLSEKIDALEADNKRLREALEIIDDHALRCAKLVKNDPCARAYVKNILDEVCAALGEVKP